MSLATPTAESNPHYHIISTGAFDERGEEIVTFSSFSPRKASISSSKCPVCENGVGSKIDRSKFPNARASRPLSLPGTAKDMLFDFLDDFHHNLESKFDLHRLHQRIEALTQEAEVGIGYYRPRKD